MGDATEETVNSLAAARQGSPEALGTALEACRAYLLLIANHEIDPALKAKGGASDLVQETFLEAQRDFLAFHGNTDVEWRAWLRQILVHNMANFARRYDAGKRELAREVALETKQSNETPRIDPAAKSPSPSTEAMAHEDVEQLHLALGRLSEDYRRVIMLHYQEHKSFAEIAETMQRSENAVRKLWFRGIEQLQDLLDARP